MQALVGANRPPEQGLLWVKRFLFGILCLPEVDVEMHHPFSKADRQNKANGCTHNDKHHNGAKRMDPGMLGPSGVKIYIAAGQHFVGLQKEISKKMFDLQKAEQQQY